MKYYYNNQVQCLANRAKLHQRYKVIVLSKYSKGIPACKKCGNTDIRVLSIDHIKGGGSNHRRKIHTTIYQWLITNGFPVGYQVLCMNCQFIKIFEENELRQLELGR